MMLRAYSWIYNQESLMKLLRDPYGVLVIKSRSPACKCPPCHTMAWPSSESFNCLKPRAFLVGYRVLLGDISLKLLISPDRNSYLIRPFTSVGHRADTDVNRTWTWLQEGPCAWHSAPAKLGVSRALSETRIRTTEAQVFVSHSRLDKQDSLWQT